MRNQEPVSFVCLNGKCSVISGCGSGIVATHENSCPRNGVTVFICNYTCNQFKSVFLNFGFIVDDTDTGSASAGITSVIKSRKSVALLNDFKISNLICFSLIIHVILSYISFIFGK